MLKSPKIGLHGAVEEPPKIKITNSKINDLATAVFNDGHSHQMSLDDLDRLMNERMNSEVWKTMGFIQCGIPSLDNTITEIYILFTAPIDKNQPLDEIKYSFPDDNSNKTKHINLQNMCLNYCFQICDFISKVKRIVK